jgi:hypothetical protein
LSSEETDLSSASVPSRGIASNKNPSFGNGMHIYHDYIRTIYFLVPGIFIEILTHLVRRDTDHMDQPAGILALVLSMDQKPFPLMSSASLELSLGDAFRGWRSTRSLNKWLTEEDV